jgi:hypothetical protein
MLTPKRVKDICRLIADGNYAKTACQTVGIHPSTFYRWLQRAERDGPNSIYAKFANSIREAEAKRERILLGLVRDGALPHGDRPGDWRAAAWMLERLMPERYGPTATIRHEGSVDRATIPSIELQLEGLDDDDLRTLEDILIKAERANGSAGVGASEFDQFPALLDARVPSKLASCSDCIEVGARENGGDKSSDHQCSTATWKEPTSD